MVPGTPRHSQEGPIETKCSARLGNRVRSNQRAAGKYGQTQRTFATDIYRYVSPGCFVWLHFHCLLHPKEDEAEAQCNFPGNDYVDVHSDEVFTFLVELFSSGRRSSAAILLVFLWLSHKKQSQ